MIPAFQEIAKNVAREDQQNELFDQPTYLIRWTEEGEAKSQEYGDSDSAYKKLYELWNTKEVTKLEMLRITVFAEPEELASLMRSKLEEINSNANQMP